MPDRGRPRARRDFTRGGRRGTRRRRGVGRSARRAWAGVRDRPDRRRRAEAFCARWIGSALWVAASPIRPHHRRKNWYVGVFRLEAPPPIPALRPEDVRFETFRAGGPGGQHQNVTDSAVRALHLPSGIAVAVRSERSQHRNKAEALARLAAALADQVELRRLESDRCARAAHEKLERGGAVRRL